MANFRAMGLVWAFGCIYCHSALADFTSSDSQVLAQIYSDVDQISADTDDILTEVMRLEGMSTHVENAAEYLRLIETYVNEQYQTVNSIEGLVDGIDSDTSEMVADLDSLHSLVYSLVGSDPQSSSFRSRSFHSFDTLTNSSFTVRNIYDWWYVQDNYNAGLANALRQGTNTVISALLSINSKLDNLHGPYDMTVMTNFYLGSMFYPYYPYGYEEFEWYNDVAPEELWEYAAPYIWHLFNAYYPVISDSSRPYIPHDLRQALLNDYAQWLNFDDPNMLYHLSEAQFRLYGTAQTYSNTTEIINILQRMNNSENSHELGLDNPVQVHTSESGNITVFNNSIINSVSGLADSITPTLYSEDDLDDPSTNAVQAIEDSAYRRALQNVRNDEDSSSLADSMRIISSYNTQAAEVLAQAKGSASFVVPLKFSFGSTSVDDEIDVGSMVDSFQVGSQLSVFFTFLLWGFRLGVSLYYVKLTFDKLTGAATAANASAAEYQAALDEL